MSHFLSVPINANGIIVDPNIDVEVRTAAVPPFKFTDVFVYSHGWWNTATNAVNEYNIFSIGFAKTMYEALAASPGSFPGIGSDFSALAMALHWPSMLSEDQDSVANFLEATSFFTMEHRADDVGQHAGYALLRLLIEAREKQPPLRFHLIGHSFGCRVLCSALQAFAKDRPLLDAATNIRAEFNVVLLQAATDADSLAAGKAYGDVLSIPKLRMLVTTSDNDKALGTWYPRAQELAHLFDGPTPAMGHVGPTGALAVPVTGRFDVLATPVPAPAGTLSVANLTPLHQAHKAAWDADGEGNGFGGQHADINLPPIYELLARFFGGGGLIPATPAAAIPAARATGG